MMVQYKRGTRYVCNHLRQQFQEPLCQVLPAGPIDQRVVELFMNAFSAIELDLHAAVLTRVRQEHRQMLAASQQQLQRLRYQARLAERQFNQSDPDNRLVTAELEKRWEQALCELKQAEQTSPSAQQEAGPFVLSPALRKTLENVGRNLPQLWPDLSPQRKKTLLRCLIEKVMLHRARSDTVEVRAAWKGGDVTSLEVQVPVKTMESLSQFDQMQQQALKLSRQHLGDQEVAKRLTQAGFRSPSRAVVLPSTVRELRMRQGILLSPGHPKTVQSPGCLTVTQLARRLGVRSHWIYDRIHNGTIQIAIDKKLKVYLFPDRPKTMEQFRKLVAGEFQIIRI